MDVDAAATVQDPAAPAALASPPAASDAPASLVVTCPTPIVTSTPFDCTLTIGTLTAAPTGGEALLRVTVPPGLFHLANSADGRFDADNRLLALPAARLARDGASSRLRVSLIADEAGAGRTRTLTASLSSTGGEAIDAVEAGGPLEKPRDAPPIQASATILVEPGPPVISSALDAPRTPLIATLLIVIAILAGLVWLRARRRAASPLIRRDAIGGSTVFGLLSLLLLFFCMPSCIETVRARTSFVTTTCTIVDRGSAGLAPEITYVPMAIVRYEAEGRTRVASGFDVRGTMYGSNEPDASRQFATGGRYPCWYDPQQPQRVILRQGPSAVAWFTLLPIVVLVLTLSALLGVWRD